jgi:oligopeptide/dipeptide ABC transporter ATP-binding protein
MKPLHPYTKTLIDSVPGRTEPETGPDESPVPELSTEEVNGCRNNPRCAYAQNLCRQNEPDLLEIEPGHLVACHFPLA